MVHKRNMLKLKDLLVNFHTAHWNWGNGSILNLYDLSQRSLHYQMMMRIPLVVCQVSLGACKRCNNFVFFGIFSDISSICCQVLQIVLLAVVVRQRPCKNLKFSLYNYLQGDFALPYCFRSVFCWCCANIRFFYPSGII